MKRFHSSQRRLPSRLILAVLAVTMCLGFSGLVRGADADSSSAKPAKKKSKLTGAELYSINCNRCHPERYPTEFNSTQWKTLMTHMRVRANLPARHAKEILKYLQEESGH